MNKKDIVVRGARENNLKNISVKIPKKKITVFTGISGSGKTSLAFDTIAAESQRLLNETYSYNFRKWYSIISKQSKRNELGSNSDSEI